MKEYSDPSVSDLTALSQVISVAMERMASHDLSNEPPHGAHPINDSLRIMHSHLVAVVQELSLFSLGLSQTANELTSISSKALSRSRSTKDSADLFRKSTQDLDSNINQAAAAAEELSINMKSVSQRAGESAGNVSSVTNSIEQMTATITEIAKNSDLARRTVENAVQSLQKATQIMSDLERAAMGINSVTGTISGISDQTKLLALNATIESARAGEAGLRFGVVANEVKALAGETNRATKDIEDKVGTMQTAARKALDEIQQIHQVMEDVNMTVSIIAAAVEEQSATAGEVSNSLNLVTNGIVEMSRSAEEASQAVQEVTLNITQAAHHADELTGQISEISSDNMNLRNDLAVIYAGAMESASRAHDIGRVVDSFQLPRGKKPNREQRVDMFHLPENQQTGISRFDSQHRELFGYFNRIHLAVKNRRPLREIIPLLHELSDFIETHCAAEEKAMEQARYSGIAAHKSDHRKMLNDMQSQLRRLEETGDVNIIELCMSLKDWVTNHIEEMDHKYIPVLQAIGMN